MTGPSRKGGTKRPRHESNCEKTSPTNKLPPTTTDTNENCVNDNEPPSSVNIINDEAVNTILAIQQQQQNLTESAGSSDEKPEVTDVKLENFEDLERKQNDITKIRNGWNLNDCSTLAIGDLYLMVNPCIYSIFSFFF